MDTRYHSKLKAGRIYRYPIMTGIHNIYGQEFQEKYGFPTPLGVKGRNSDNRLFRENIGWAPSQPLIEGMRKTYEWIESQVNNGEK